MGPPVIDSHPAAPAGTCGSKLAGAASGGDRTTSSSFHASSFDSRRPALCVLYRCCNTTRARDARRAPVHSKKARLPAGLVVWHRPMQCRIILLPSKPGNFPDTALVHSLRKGPSQLGTISRAGKPTTTCRPPRDDTKSAQDRLGVQYSNDGAAARLQMIEYHAGAIERYRAFICLGRGLRTPPFRPS
ncbi:uncharacterized protein B0I36DRAFT_344014 [Microdochium trichocladiopsis]|uniref:Uncharacterized protein n=1 Tax=Microdochium trichocladiopsis TaxID=1682393 RepID=A0A9P8YGS3_9PEZI|nr:uncharacterized protein B0I36DRAFT_344014 [Microdochium trichocladiopsis]KAH7040236.1 hypothetical protein B0I36DRAFT_344014 [Microdochium trichocladiopsis]